MARHRIDQALLDQTRPTERRGPEGRRVPVDDPYAEAKSALYHCVADANGCRAIYSPRLAMVTVFGTPLDLDLVETLTTSLLVQATVAMQAAGPQRDASGRSTTRSFRRAFYLSFAYRVAERLTEAVESVHDQLDDAERSRALPVLASRRAEVTAAVDEAYPNLVSTTTRVTNGAGWEAGRLAADAADLSAGPAVRPPTRT